LATKEVSFLKLFGHSFQKGLLGDNFFLTSTSQLIGYSSKRPLLNILPFPKYHWIIPWPSFFNKIPFSLWTIMDIPFHFQVNFPRAPLVGPSLNYFRNLPNLGPKFPSKFKSFWKNLFFLSKTHPQNFPNFF